MELGLKNEENSTCRLSVLRYRNIYTLTLDWQRYMVFLIILGSEGQHIYEGKESVKILDPYKLLTLFVNFSQENSNWQISLLELKNETNVIYA